MTEPQPDLLRVPAPFAKIRAILVSTAVFWTLMTAVTVYGNGQLSAEDLGDTPLWATVAAPAFVAVYAAFSAWRTRPGDRKGWGLAVGAMALNLLGCLTLPLAVWGLALLFKPQTKAQMLGGRFLRRPGSAPTPPKQADEPQ